MRLLAVTVAALGIAGGAAGAAELGSGLRGVVTRSQPVCTVEECERPAAGVVLEFRRAGRLVARVRSGTGGRYLVRLRPGWYAVRTPSARVGNGLIPRSARVPHGLFGRVDFHLDTGIQ